MRDPPAGIVTFLFTDIEGSTRLWERVPGAMQTALARHDAILRETIESHGGRVFKTVGDAFLTVFGSVADAVGAALDGQRALGAEPWGETGPLRVRMAIHAGPAEEREGDYLGPTLNRLARLVSAGRGTQTLLSEVARDLVRAALPDGASLRDLGSHRLRDLQRPEHIYQLLHADLPADFPPPRTLDALPNNLPVQLTSFIGREREIAEVRRILSRARLVTLTGVGGSGKTRLAQQVAVDLLEEFTDGVWHVELGTISDLGLVPQTVATALGVREEPGLPLESTLADYLQNRQALLILDNCEHLVAACARLAEVLLQACPDVKILATSREALGIAGEIAWTVPSLSVADPRGPTDPASLRQYEAVRLFAERAEAVSPAFRLTPQNALAVMQISHRLDGIPLAIELAAARVRVLTVEQIAERLDDRFRLLSGGSRTALPRQQTLLATMDWSYGLLEDKERMLFRRLSVFAGTCTLEASERVCAGDGLEPHEVLDLLTRLVDKSLVVVEDREGQASYRLLESVRQYSQDKLLASGEVRTLRGRHQEYFLAVAEAAEPELQGPDQKRWFDRLDAEHDNLRAALEWSIGEGTGDAGLRLAGALWWFWYVRGYLTEGSAWLREALKTGERTRIRVKALSGAATLSIFVGDHAETERLGGESLALARELGDIWGVAFSLIVLAVTALAQGRRDQAAALVEESLTLSGQIGHRWGTAVGLAVQGRLTSARRDYEKAIPLLEESLVLFRQLGDRWGIAFSQAGLGLVARLAGDYDRATALYKEALATSRDLGNKQGMAQSLFESGQARWRQRDYTRAATLFAESRELFEEMGEKINAAYALYYEGLVANYLGDEDRAAQVLNKSLAAFRDLDRKDGIAYVLEGLGRISLQRGDANRAAELSEESLTLFRAARDHWGQATALHLMGRIALHRGESDRAATLGAQSLEIFRRLGDRWAVAPLLRFLGYAHLARGHLPDAAAHVRESLALRMDLGDRLGIAEGLEGLAAVASAEGQPDRAARWLGSASALRDAIGAPVPLYDRGAHERLEAAVRAALGEGAAADEWAKGQAMPLDEVITTALSASPSAGR